MKTDKPNPGHKPGAEDVAAKVTVGGLGDHVVGINEPFERFASSSVVDATTGKPIPGASVLWSVSTSPSHFDIVLESQPPFNCKLSGVGGAYDGDDYSVTMKATYGTAYGLAEFKVKTRESAGAVVAAKNVSSVPPGKHKK